MATPIDGDVLARMAAEAEARLRALGQGTFEVQEFKPGPGKPVVFTDDFELRTRVYFLDYDARLHFSRDFTGPTRSDIVGRSTQPGWSIDQAERDLEMLHAVPPGAHAAGSEVESKAAAAFIDLEPGWRFDRLDGRRR